MRAPGFTILVTTTLLCGACSLRVTAERRVRDGGREVASDAEDAPLPPDAADARDVSDLVPEAGTPGTGLRGDYFNDATNAHWVFVRLDPNVDFDWGAGSPDSRIPADNFSARWTGWVTATTSEAYTFYVHVDDGVRLWVNGQQLVEQWYAPAGQDFSNTVQMAAGQPVVFKVEYYEKTGNAAIRVEWSSPTVARQVIPKSRFTPAAMD